MSNKVTVYVTDYCPYCNAAKRFLSSNGIEFDVVDVTQNVEKRNWLVQTTGMRTVPQIFVGDTPVGGYTDMDKMHRQGNFVPLLNKNEVEHTFSA